MQNHTIILVFSQIICAVCTGMPAALQTCIPAINSYIEPFNGFKSIKKQQENWLFVALSGGTMIH